MKPLVNMIGQRIGRLVVIERAANADGGRAQWRCRCDCGNETVQPGKVLRKAIVRSCGCLRRETTTTMGLATRKHGQAVNPTPEYRAWRSAIDRCHNPESRNFKNYGARGIAVCPEWRGSFEAFFAHLGVKPTPKHTLERVDNHRGYEPGNVRWATYREQGNNRRDNHVVEINGEKMTLAEAIRRKGQKSSRVRQRLAIGWSVERALDAPKGG